MSKNWNEIRDNKSLEEIQKASFLKPQLIFKHSTRCGTSSWVKRELDNELEGLGNEFELHILDLLSYRDLSNIISEKYELRHESPQVLVLKNGELVAHFNHGDVAPEEILKKVTH